MRRVNEDHARICNSPEWADYMQNELLPSFLTNVSLGAEMLELGPGPGATTEWLRHRVGRLTAVELDEEAAEKLRARFAGTIVDVATGDATALTYPDESFDSVGAFTMLHHIPTAAAQNRLFAEALRVLRPNGVFVGSDSSASARMHGLHTDDVYNPIEPGTLLTRLQTIGFTQVTLIVDDKVKFIARKNELASSVPGDLASSQRADGDE